MFMSWRSVQRAAVQVSRRAAVKRVSLEVRTWDEVGVMYDMGDQILQYQRVRLAVRSSIADRSI